MQEQVVGLCLSINIFYRLTTTIRRQHMAITKETQIGKIEVVGKYKSVQVRTDTVVMEDQKNCQKSIIDML
jgi:hypothetical protein